MTARKAMLNYGLVEENGLFKNPRVKTDTWRAEEGGFLLFSPSTPGIDGGEPWGLPVEGDYIQVPYRVSDKWQGVSGLHPFTHPECFDWTWPESRVEEIYAHGSTPDGNPWRRRDDGKLVKVTDKVIEEK